MGIAILQGRNQRALRPLALSAQHAEQLGSRGADFGGVPVLATLVAEQFAKHTHGLGAGTRFSQQVLSDELLRLLDQMYQPRTLFQPDDFTELAAILAQY